MTVDALGSAYEADDVGGGCWVRKEANSANSPCPNRP